MASEIDVITVIIGIILALITTFCFNLAIVFQKKGLREGLRTGSEIKIEEGLKSIILSFKMLFKNKSWMIGTLLGIIGWFPYIISIGLVGIIVTEPVMATGFIFFVIAANRMLGEKVGKIEYAAIGMLTVSPILITLAGISDVSFNLHEFVPPLIIFLIVSLSISFFSFYLAKKTRGSNSEGLFIMLGGAILFALGGVFTNILAQAFIQANMQIKWYFLFELIFGVFWFIFTDSYAHLWIFLGFWGMVTFNLSSVPFYQGGFQKGKVLIMYPILDSIALLLPIMAGLFVFRQTFSNFYLFFTALILIIVGTLALSKYQVAIETMGTPKKSEPLEENITNSTSHEVNDVYTDVNDEFVDANEK